MDGGGSGPWLRKWVFVGCAINNIWASQSTNKAPKVDFQYPKSDYCRLRECNDLVFVRNGILRESQVTCRSVELLNRSLNPVLLACLVAGCRTPPLLYLNHIFVSNVYCCFACDWQDKGLGCIFYRGVKQDQSDILKMSLKLVSKKYFKTDIRGEIQKR